MIYLKTRRIDLVKNFDKIIFRQFHPAKIQTRSKGKGLSLQQMLEIVSVICRYLCPSQEKA